MSISPWFGSIQPSRDQLPVVFCAGGSKRAAKARPLANTSSTAGEGGERRRRNHADPGMVISRVTASSCAARELCGEMRDDEVRGRRIVAVAETARTSRRRWDGCRPPRTASECAKRSALLFIRRRGGRRMKDTMIDVDLAKNVFQVHEASMTGHLLFARS